MGGSSTVTAIESLPLRSADEAFLGCQRAVVVAPHPDDETLGCGGAIALLQQRSIPVHVLVMSDGTQSHPDSKSYPADRLRVQREQETCAALKGLGISEPKVTFFRWPDTAVPGLGDQDFATAVNLCSESLQRCQPSLLFVPWQHDQHCDHRATWQIVQQAVSNWPQPPRQVVYSIWGDRAAGLPALPPGETGWRLDIRAVVAVKRQAVMAHQSQTTDLINDDPSGFRLTPAMLNNLIQPWETYLEVK
ncbi:PIG-L family deacetylase [soil metagenome]